MNIGKNIKQIREFKNISQDFVAHELEISQSTYAKIENGQLIPKIDRLQNIAKILEVDLSALINSTNNFTINFNAQANQSGYINTQSNSLVDIEAIRQVVQEEMKKNQ
jgi:transcriptional regulator with XRE-family HTH domain